MRGADALIEASEILWKWGKGVFWAAMVFVIFSLTIGGTLIYVAPSSAYGYGFKYSVADSKVSIGLRPHDCEWGSAPLGK